MYIGNRVTYERGNRVTYERCSFLPPVTCDYVWRLQQFVKKLDPLLPSDCLLPYVALLV